MPIEDKTTKSEDSAEDIVDENVEVEAEKEEESDTHENIGDTDKRTRKRIATPSGPPLHELNANTQKAVKAGVDRNNRMEKALKSAKTKFEKAEEKANKADK